MKKSKNTIEKVAKILLQNRIEFTYEQEHLKVNDQTIRYDLFATASYHNRTNELVLMNDKYEAVSYESFLKYFSK